MKKVQVLITTILFFLVFTLPTFASPAPTTAPPAGTFRVNPCSDTNAAGLNKMCSLELGNVVGKFIIYSFMFGAIIALLYLLWGGFKWITSGGDTKGVEGARSHIIAAIIGLIVIFLSYLILNFVVKLLTGSDLNQLNFPSL